MRDLWAVCLMNVAIVAIFAVTAVKLDRWWIILFSALVIAVCLNSGRKEKEGAGSE